MFALRLLLLLLLLLVVVDGVQMGLFERKRRAAMLRKSITTLVGSDTLELGFLELGFICPT